MTFQACSGYALILKSIGQRNFVHVKENGRKGIGARHFRLARHDKQQSAFSGLELTIDELIVSWSGA
jgi:hypothetical protein